MILGVLLVIGLVVAVVLVNSNKTKVKTFEDLTEGMTTVGTAHGMEHCHNYNDTLLGEANPISEVEGLPDDAQAFICASVDLTSLEAVLLADNAEEPHLMLGMYSESTGVDSSDAIDFGDADTAEDEWAIQGEHWGVYSTNLDAKDDALDTLGGTLVTSE